MARIHLTHQAGLAMMALPVGLLAKSLIRWGTGVLVFLESYVDESGSHEGSPVLCLAGYAIDTKQVDYFNGEWKEVLAKYDLPYFRMSECAHNSGKFKPLLRQDCIDIETRMIGIIKRRVEHGFAVTVNEAEYNRLIGQRTDLYGDAYCKCLRFCVESVTAWRERYSQTNGKVAFIFESGHSSQHRANAMMDQIFNVPALKERHGYPSHVFAAKACVPGLQAADLVSLAMGNGLQAPALAWPAQQNGSNEPARAHA